MTANAAPTHASLVLLVPDEVPEAALTLIAPRHPTLADADGGPLLRRDEHGRRTVTFLGADPDGGTEQFHADGSVARARLLGLPGWLEDDAGRSRLAGLR